MELDWIKSAAITAGANEAVVCSHWSQGSLGASALADAVMRACEEKNNFKFLYDLDQPIKKKIETIAKEMYGAGKVEYEGKVLEALERYESQGYGKLPVCMAKTANSLTGDPAMKGAPVGFTLHISDVFLSAGAGFVVPMVGEVSSSVFRWFL